VYNYRLSAETHLEEAFRKTRYARRRAFLSAGAWVIIFLALVSSALILFRPEHTSDGLILWSAAREHFVMYEPMAEEWNRTHTPTVHPRLLSNPSTPAAV